MRLESAGSREGEQEWLDFNNKDTADLRELLVPYDASAMEAYEVSPLVNAWANETPEVIGRRG